MGHWTDRAACKGLPVDYFFDDYLRSSEVFETVNNLCAQCPIQITCLTFGKATKSIGVWGGEYLQYGVPVEVALE